ncbi:MAG: NAD-dependent epimerase/dehydratase family protein [Gemmataceae bacterium]|nr:NAD-dependent epimerase/dehydratase family protein [Gemmataceae bacterium]
MRVLITGGFGCIGSWVVRNLLDRGDRAWIYDLRPDFRRMRLLLNDDELERLPFIAGTVTDPAALRDAILQNGITHVLHLAGLQVPVCRENPILGAQVNVVGTLAVFEAVRQARDQVQQVVYASSAAVFAAPEYYLGAHHPLSDDAPLHPSTHYGVFKVANENNARIYWQDHQLRSIGIRPGTVYGVARDFGMTSEPTKAIKSAVLGRPWTISYEGLQGFQYADDVARTLIRCLESPLTGARVYNLRGQVDTVARFHELLCETLPAARELITLGRNKIVLSSDFDDSSIRRDIAGLPDTSLADGIRQTVAQFQVLRVQGRLDDSDLVSAPARTVDEP